MEHLPLDLMCIAYISTAKSSLDGRSDWQRMAAGHLRPVKEIGRNAEDACPPGRAEKSNVRQDSTDGVPLGIFMRGWH